MNIIFLNEGQIENWDLILKKLSVWCFNYSFIKHSFNLEYTPFQVLDKSFYIEYENEIGAFVPLYIERVNKEYQISILGSYNPVPLINTEFPYNKQEKILKRVFMEIDKIASELECRKIMFQFDPLINPHMNLMMYNHNFLQEFGYLDESLLNRIIDLSVSEKVFHSDIRGNYLRDIKKSKLIFDTKIINDLNFEHVDMDRFVCIYNQAAGFETRSMEFSSHYCKWILDKKAIIGVAIENDKLVSEIMYIIDNNRAYYAFSAEIDRGSKHLSVGPLLHHRLLMYLRKNRVEFIDMGVQYYASSSNESSKTKDINISFFKRGFGGYNVPLFRGTKFIKESQNEVVNGG